MTNPVLSVSSRKALGLNFNTMLYVWTVSTFNVKQLDKDVILARRQRQKLRSKTGHCIGKAHFKRHDTRVSVLHVTFVKPPRPSVHGASPNQTFATVTSPVNLGFSLFPPTIHEALALTSVSVCLIGQRWDSQSRMRALMCVSKSSWINELSLQS